MGESHAAVFFLQWMAGAPALCLVLDTRHSERLCPQELSDPVVLWQFLHKPDQPPVLAVRLLPLLSVPWEVRRPGWPVLPCGLIPTARAWGDGTSALPLVPHRLSCAAPAVGHHVGVAWGLVGRSLQDHRTASSRLAGVLQ